MNEWWLLGILLILLIVALSVLFYPLRTSKLSTMLMAPILFTLVTLSYWHWGAWPEWKNHLHRQERLQQAQAMLQSMRNPQEVIDRLKARLTLQPDSARGWYLLGRLYVSQDQWQNAHDAYTKAHQLQPDNDQITVNYAQTLWQLNHQQFNDEIRKLFQSVLQNNVNQPDALAMLAMDAFVGHSYQLAIDYWQRLLTLAPPQSEDAEAIRKAIAKAQQSMSS